MEARIKLNNVQITDLSLKAESYKSGLTSDLVTALTFSEGYTKELSKLFFIRFDIKINNKEESFKLNLIATAHFESTVLIDEDFQNSNFPKINAPAIAFPYIRTFISNITLNSGYNPVILPTFNFTDISGGKIEDN